jgi:hypothetical protein
MPKIQTLQIIYNWISKKKKKKKKLFEMASYISPFYTSASTSCYLSTDQPFLSSPLSLPLSGVESAAAAPHFLEDNGSIEEYTKKFWVEKDDTESMLPDAHITANAIRHLVVKDYFYVNRVPSGIVLVDPMWLGGWESLGMPMGGSLSHDTLALALPSLPPVFSTERGPLLSSDVPIPLNTATFVICVQCRETSFSII